MTRRWWDRRCINAGVAVPANQPGLWKCCARLMRATAYEGRAVLADSHTIRRTMAAARVERARLGMDSA